jgi:hypothetical protein
MTEQVKIDDSVVRKIQLLLNMAARAEGNEAEAAAAMAKAQDMLAKYNLDMATVQDAVVAGGTNASATDVKREKVEGKRNATYMWTQRLVRAIAEANYCVYWAADVRVVNEKSGRVRWIKRHRVLGRIDNTTVVLMMTDYLYGTIMRLLPYDKSTWLSSEALMWCDGCVDRLIERINAKAQEMRTPDYATQGEQGYCTALAISTMAEKERIANYDAVNGEGAWAKKLARDAAYEAGRAERVARWALEAKESEAREAARLLAETPVDRARRERLEAAAQKKSDKWSARYWARQEKAAQREAAKLSSAAYRSGRAKGGAIGLDTQLSTTKTPVLQ